MHLLQVRMTAMDVAAIRAALVVSSATLIEWTRRTALTGQVIARMPSGRMGSGARRSRRDADRIGAVRGSNPWTAPAGHHMASRLGADDVLTIRESLAAGAAVPDDLAVQYLSLIHI